MSGWLIALLVVVLVAVAVVVTGKRLKRVRKRYPLVEEQVNLDQDSIPLNDNGIDALYFGMVMRFGAISMHAVDDHWVVNVHGKGTWSGRTQREALEKAQEEL